MRGNAVHKGTDVPLPLHMRVALACLDPETFQSTGLFDLLADNAGSKLPACLLLDPF